MFEFLLTLRRNAGLIINEFKLRITNNHQYHLRNEYKTH